MRTALVAMMLVIDLSPGGLQEPFGGPQVNSMPETLVTAPPEVDPALLPRLLRNRGRATEALEGGMFREMLAMCAQFAQQARLQLCAGVRQRSKDKVVRVLPKKIFNAFTVFLELQFNLTQQLGQGNRQEALGVTCRRAAAKLCGPPEYLQAFFVEFGAPGQAVYVEKFFVAATSGGLQLLGGWKCKNEIPGALRSPVLEGLQGRGIVLVEGRFDLMNLGGAFFDQGDFIPGEETELLGQFILRAQQTPVLTVGTQCVGQNEGIELIVTGAAAAVAFTKRLRLLRRHGVDANPDIQEPLDHPASTGLDSKGQGGEVLDALTEVRPACGRFLESKGRRASALDVEHHDVMVVAGEIQRAKVGEFCKRLHDLSPQVVGFVPPGVCHAPT